MSTGRAQYNPPGPRAISWQTGIVERVAIENYRAKTFTVKLSDWTPFRPGQHFDVRLTAPDGYQAQRSYSIGSAPEIEGVIDLTIELIPDGEVSLYFHEAVQPGDEIELRGPIGGPFTWTGNTGGPLLLIAGGSGIVPLMSMVRHRGNSANDVRALLLYSSRSLDDIIYGEELEQRGGTEPNLTVLHTLTRFQPEGWQGYSRRIDRLMVEEAIKRLDSVPHIYACGPTPFVEAAADISVAFGIPPERIRTERFGPSGT